MGPGDEKICFVIAPIGEEGSEARKHSDQVLKHVISPPVEARGFKALRADMIAEPGMITTQVIQHVLDDPLVVADLSFWNPNVFYELALRHAVGKAFIQLIRKGDRNPFDVGGMRTIPFDLTEPDSWLGAKDELVRQVEAALKPDAVIETPIMWALKLKSLRDSGDPQDRTLSDILAQLEALRGSVEDVKQLVSPPREARVPPREARVYRAVRRQPGLSTEEPDTLRASAIVEEGADRAKETNSEKP